jgi:PAS domain S-box-containing protein
MGKKIIDLIVEDHKNIVREEFQKVLKGEEIKIDIPLYHKNGSERIVTAVIQPQWENELVIGAFGVARDITERHRLENLIRESEAKYRSLMEHANDAILLVDPESVQILQVNNMASELTGYSQKELIGKSILDLRRLEDRDYAMDRFGHILLHGSGYFEDAPIIRKDGTPVRVELSGRVVEIEGQKILQSIMRDVTEQREMEEELRQRISQLSILTEITDVLQSTLELNDVLSIILTGVTAGQGFGFNRAFILFLEDDGKVLRGQVAIGPSNVEEAGRIWGELSQKPRTLREMLEYYREVMTSKDVMVNDLVRNITIDIADAINVFAKAIKDKTPVNVTDTHHDPNMPKDMLSLLQVNALAIIPLVSRDNVLGLLLVDNMINQDPITDEDVDLLRVFANSSAIAIENARLVSSLEEKVVDLKEAYKELKDSRDRLVKTEKLSAVGEVATSVAHEIRNPLVSIGGFAQTVLNKMDEGDNRRQYLEIIVDEVRRLESILGEILNYARPVVPHFVESDLNEMIRQTVGMIRVETDEEIIEMKCNLVEELPKLWFDPDQMRQVMLNLLRNAVHAMPDGGTLTVSTELQDDIVSIEIKDTGVGISGENLNKIFTAFFTTKSTGSGLGLTICSQIIHNHGGSIGVTSKEGEGSSFVISLPIRRKSERQ